MILLFFAVAGFIYMKSKVRDETILRNFPKEVKDAFDLRMKYTGVLLAFILVITLLYFVAILINILIKINKSFFFCVPFWIAPTVLLEFQIHCFH